MSRGAALLETLVVGFAAVLLAGYALVAAGRLAAAGSAAAEAATVAAQRLARTGDVGEAELPSGAELRIVEEGGRTTVVVAVPVSLLGPHDGPVTVTVTGRATVPRSPYRSGP